MTLLEVEEPIFRPRYSLWALLAVYGLPLVFLGLLFLAANLSGLSVAFLIFVWIVGWLAALAPFFFVRYIVFREKMVIRRYLLPDVRLDYREVQRVDADAIHTTGRKVRLGNPRNLADLQEMVRRWQAARLLQERVPRPAAATELPSRGYASYGFIWGMMFGILALYLVPVAWKVDARWVFGAVFLLVYILLTYVLPRKL